MIACCQHSLLMFSLKKFDLQDPYAMRGGIGEKAVRQIVDHAHAVADRAMPSDQEAIHRLCSEVNSMVETVCELRQDGKGTSPQVYNIYYTC